jgi:hypothetical protein
MAIDERARHELYLRLEEHLGPEAAATLMEHLPPTGWGEVATKRDLDQLADRLRVEMRDLAIDVQRTISRQTWMLAFTMFSASVAAAFSAIGVR